MLKIALYVRISVSLFVLINVKLDMLDYLIRCSFKMNIHSQFIFTYKLVLYSKIKKYYSQNNTLFNHNIKPYSLRYADSFLFASFINFSSSVLPSR